MNVLNDIGVANISAGALVAVIVLSIIRGLLVPRSAVVDLRADRDARLAEVRTEANDWRAAFSSAETARQLQAGQIAELLELARTTDHFIKSLPVATRNQGHS